MAESGINNDVSVHRNSSPPPSAEWQLILTCARTRLDGSHRARIHRLLQGPLDWNRVIEAASQHSVEGLLHRGLSSLPDLPAETIPAEPLLSFQKSATQRTQWSLRLAGQMVELLERCSEAGLMLIPYKGPTLALVAYGDLGLRFAGDLDFMIRQRDVAHAFDVLSAGGYRGELDPARPHDARLIARGNHVGQYCFRQPGHGLVELHTENTLRYFPAPLDWETLSRRLRSVSVGSHTVYTFSVEDLLVLLSVHGAKHFWNRLGWVCDIAELSQRDPGIDWRLSETVATEVGCRRMWLLGLSLANAVLDAPLPATVLDQIHKDSVVVALSRTLENSLLAGNQADPGAPQRLMFRMRSNESLVMGLRQCVRLVTQPTETDWLVTSLPGWAAPLHILLRPWRLLRKYGFGGGSGTRANGKTR